MAGTFPSGSCASAGAIAACLLAIAPATGQTAPPATGQAGAPLPDDPAAPARVDRPASTPEAAAGAPPAQQGLEDIVVTAQRRSENLQDVPVAVTALSATALATANVAEVLDLRIAVPSLNITNNNGILSTSLRGIGSTGVNPGFENPVAIYVDGVYIASTVANFAGLSDVAQVEVLKGPQGTLFGRNATAGLIQIATRTPSQEPVVEAKVSYGNYDTVEGNLYVSGGLTDSLAASFAAYGLHQGDGFGRNRTTGADTYKVERNILLRAKIVWEPTATTRVALTGDFTSIRRNDLAGLALPGTVNVNAPAAGPTPDIGYDQVADSPTFKEGQAGGGGLRVDQTIGDVVASSITAYRKSRFTTAFDYDATPARFADIRYRQPEDQFSQELQLQPDRTGRFVWVVGAYYFNARAAYDPFDFGLYALGQLLTLTNRQKTESLAGYAQGAYAIADRTKLTLGARYTTETRRAVDGLTLIDLPAAGVTIPVPAADAKATFDKFTFRVALDHRFNEELLGYASFNRGFKSGGFNTGSPGTPAYAPETVDAYEMGLKSDLLGRNLRINVAGYYYDYTDIQSQNLTQGVIAIVNAATAEVYGLDLDLEAILSPRLRLSGGLGLNHAEYTSYPNAPISDPRGGVPSTFGDVSGRDLPLASKVTANVAALYTAPLKSGTLTAGANLFYNSGYSLEADNVIRQPAFAQLGSTVSWTDAAGRLSIGVWGKNLTNKRTLAFSTTLPEGVHGFLFSPPRTYGATLGYKF